MADGLIGSDPAEIASAFTQVQHSDIYQVIQGAGVRHDLIPLSQGIEKQIVGLEILREERKFQEEEEKESERLKYLQRF